MLWKAARTERRPDKARSEALKACIVLRKR